MPARKTLPIDKIESEWFERYPKDIADDLGVSTGLVKRRAEELGLPSRRELKRKRQASEIVFIKKSVGSMSNREIAEEIESSYSWVKKFVTRRGLRDRKTFEEEYAESHEESLEEYLWREYKEKGRYKSDLAEELEVSVKTVHNYLERYGIKKREERGRVWEERRGEMLRKVRENGEKGIEWVEENPEEFRDLCLSGEDSPHWVEDRSELTCRYAGEDYIEWRRSILDRDGRQCVECGSTDNLEAHHIRTWKDYPELRFVVDNGVTLCVGCHRPLNKNEEKVEGYFYAYVYRVNDGELDDRCLSI